MSSVGPVHSVMSAGSRLPERYPLGLTLAYCDGLARAGEQLVLTGRSSVLIGYEERLFAGGPLEDPRMGMRHATLVPELDGWKLVDRGTKHGTCVDGVRVREHVLSPGQVIRIGSTFLVYGHIAPQSRALMLNSVGAAMAEVEEQISQFARGDDAVLLLGENGTGKELVAHELHRLSGRMGPFFALNCAALSADQLERALFANAAMVGPRDVRARPSSHIGIEPTPRSIEQRIDVMSSSVGFRQDDDVSKALPEGVFQRAPEGSVFLDEASEMAPAVQERLLAMLEAGCYVALDSGASVPCTTRLIVATSQETALLPGLRARLGPRSVKLPALRERREDLGVLVRVLLSRTALGLDVAPELMAALMAAWFPHNIRGLIAVLTAARRSQPKVSRLDLDAAVRAALAAEARPESDHPSHARKPL